MSSVPGRSDSQRSYAKGDDELSIRNIRDNGKDVEGRKSGVGSMRSEGSSSPSCDAIALHDSCALKHFSKHKSSHLRFLAWVAYTRKFADDSITNEERRTCPLLWCRMEFVDEQAMLKHVWDCPHLSKGLYWCFHCQKHERLGKFHKRCTGLPSRTDRLATVARKIFSKLGAGSHRKAPEKTSSEGSFSLTDCWRSTDEKKANLYDNLPQWDYPCVQGLQELPDTSICSEMEADWTPACQELGDTSIMEMMGTELGNGFGNEVCSYQDNFYAETFDELNVTPAAPKATLPFTKLPRLDTSMSPLYTGEWRYPVQNLDQVSPSRTIAGLSLDDIVSPMSADGTCNMITSLNVSPTETVVSGASFFSDSGYASATSAGDGSSGCCSRVSSVKEQGTKRTWDCAIVQEEFDVVDAVVAPILFPVSLPEFDQVFTESLMSTPSVSRSSSNASDKSKARDLSPHWDDAFTLVQSFSEVLDEHIAHTKATVRQLPPNEVTSELLAMSKSSMVSIGLEVLAGILEGRKPSAAVQVFAFTHVACACAIAMSHDSDVIHKAKWFEDSIAWVSGLASERQKPLYAAIATSIWKPQASVQNLAASQQTSASNQLLKACQHFLDVLENYDTQAKEALIFQSAASGFDFNQFSFEFKANSLIIEKLITINTIEAFIADVTAVGKKLNGGRIKTPRALELELICAGKMSSQSETAYSRFLSHVARLCDDLYHEESTNSKSRTSYHIADISLLKNYLPEEDFGHDVSALDFHCDDEDLCFDFVGASGERDRMEGKSTPSHHDEHPQHFTPFSQPSSSTTPFTSLTPQSSNININLNSDSAPLPLTQLYAPTPPPRHATPISFHPPPPPPPSNATTTPSRQSTPAAATTSHKYRCPIPGCNYTPLGEEKWKASNLRRHKRTQHQDHGTKTYACRWPGCQSVFTRSDNLRSHQRGRGHGVFAGESAAAGGQRKRRCVDEGEFGGDDAVL